MGDFFSGLAIFGEGAKGFFPATITRLKEVWQKEYNEWARRRLDGKEYVYVWADGIYCNARLDDQKLCLFVIIGVTVDGKKELVAVHQGGRESEESWLEVLRDLKFRGLTAAPKLAICDGALGFQNAVDKVWGQMKIQRCWVHIRTSNPIESMFATVRLRHMSTKGNGSADATLAMVFKLCKEAEKNWRRLKGFEKLQLVKEDKTFVDGILQIAA